MESPSAAMYGFGNLFAAQVPKQVIEKRVRPIFLLFHDAVA